MSCLFLLNCCSFQVLTFVAAKLHRVNTQGCSNSVAPFGRVVIVSYDERDPEYVPPGTVTPARAARTTRHTPLKVEIGLVTASLYEEEHILNGTPSGFSTHSSDASGFEEVSCSEEVSGS